MRRAAHWALAAAVGAVAGAAAAAPARADEIIAMQDGPPIVGEVVSCEGDAFRLRTGDALLTVEFWRVTPEALYRLLKARTPLDAPAKRLELAATLQRFFAFDAARTELRAARALDPALRETVALKMADVDDAHAAWLLQAGREALVGERFSEAVTRLEEAATRFAGSPAADKARALLPAAREGAAKQAKAGPAAADPATPKVDARVAKAVAALLQRIDANLAAAATALKTGHRADAKGRTAEAAEAYEDAAAKDRAARDWAERIVQAAGHAPAEAVTAARERLHRVDAHCLLVFRALAALYMVRKDFPLARSYVLQALEIEPADTDVLALKAKIESEMVRETPKKDDGTPGSVTKAPGK